MLSNFSDYLMGGSRITLHCRIARLNAAARAPGAGSGYIVGLPVAAFLTWEGRLIEGKGVSPTLNVGMKPEQLLLGEDPQMQRALETVRGM